MASGPPKSIVKAITRFHIFLYRTSGGKIWGKQVGIPVLLLTTTGRKSGLARTTPVVFHKEGDSYFIAASNGGFDGHSAWYYNIKANPQVKFEIGKQSFSCEANILEGAERDRVYEIFKSLSDNFVKYEQTATNRTIPVIELIPS